MQNTWLKQLLECIYNKFAPLVAANEFIIMNAIKIHNSIAYEINYLQLFKLKFKIFAENLNTKKESYRILLCDVRSRVWYAFQSIWILCFPFAFLY